MVLDILTFSPYYCSVFIGSFIVSSDLQRQIGTMPCTEPLCRNGKIVVHNAYAEDPLKGEEQTCDVCQGLGFVVFKDKIAIAN